MPGRLTFDALSRTETLLILALVVGSEAGCSHAAPLPKEQAHVTEARWASSRNLEITLNAFGKAPVTLTRGFRDFKPSWSGTGTRLTFFRLLSAGRTFDTWKTKLCVVAADGSGLRELSNGAYADFNPTWTRDGTDRVIFNRYAARCRIPATATSGRSRA